MANGILSERIIESMKRLAAMIEEDRAPTLDGDYPVLVGVLHDALALVEASEAVTLLALRTPGGECWQVGGAALSELGKAAQAGVATGDEIIRCLRLDEPL